MTTPNQLPIDRAFVIGGSTANPSTDTSYAGNNFGQDYSDSAIRALFEIPAITLSNVIEVFTTLLLRLPLEALKIFEPIIPGGLENFTDVITAVNAIVGSLTEVVTMLPMAIFQAFTDIISGNPGAAFEDVANLLKGGLDAIHQLVDSMLDMLGLEAVGTLLDKIFDLVDGLDGEFLSLDGLLGNFDDLLGIFGGTGGLSGVQNFITNFLKIFGITDITNLTGSTGSFNPTTILTNFITGKLNPLDILEDSGLRDFFKQLLDTLTSILRLIPFVGNSIADSIDNLADGMEAQTDTVIGTAAQTSQIMAALGTGVPDADTFERSSLGSKWRVITSGGGSATVDGHNLVMAHNDNTDYVLLSTDKLAGSDFQTSEIVLGSAPGFSTVLLDSARGHNDVWLRCTDFTTWATRTGIRCRWSGQNKNIKLSAWVNGSEVATIFNAAVSSASASSKLTVEAGSNGNPRRFIIRVNGSIIPGGDVVESGTSSQFGPNNRRRGLGGATEKLVLTHPDPGTVQQWTATG